MSEAGYGNALRLALKEVEHLRYCYTVAFRTLEPANESVRKLRAAIATDDLRSALQSISSPGVTRIAPRRADQISRRTWQREEALGSFFGFGPKEVRHHIRRCSHLPEWTVPVITHADGLHDYIGSYHEYLRSQFAGAPRGILRRSQRGQVLDESESFVFSIGILLADGLRQSDMPTSYGIFNILVGAI